MRTFGRKIRWWEKINWPAVRGYAYFIISVLSITYLAIYAFVWLIGR